MKKERYEELSRTGVKLEPEEMREGWHYCPDFDYDLIKGDQEGKGRHCYWCDFSGDMVHVPEASPEAKS